MSAIAAKDPDQIRERAYQLWQADGCPEGLALDYWLRAEADLAGTGDATDSAIAGDDKPPAPMDEPVVPRQTAAPRGSRKSREGLGGSSSGAAVAAEDGGESSVA